MSRTHDYELKQVKNGLLNIYGNYCWLCGKQFSKKQLTAHHIIEKQHGGLTNAENIAIVCNNCHTNVINRKQYGSKSYKHLMKKLERWKKRFEHKKQEYISTYGSYCCLCKQYHCSDNLIILPVEKNLNIKDTNISNYVLICEDCYQSIIEVILKKPDKYRKIIAQMIKFRNQRVKIYNIKESEQVIID